MKEDWFVENLSDAQQSWVFDKIPEEQGAPYCVLHVEQLHTEARRLEGIAVFGSDYSGDRSFLGILGPTHWTEEPEHFASRVVALAIPASCPPFDGARVRDKLASESESVILDIISRSRHLSRNSELSLLTTERIYYSYPNIAGVAAIVEDRKLGLDFLYCLIRHSSQEWKIVPFDKLTAMKPTGNGGVVFREHYPEHHGSMRNPSLTVLPDLNGDGRDEFLIISDTTTEFCSIATASKNETNLPFFDEEFAIREVRAVYFY